LPIWQETPSAQWRRGWDSNPGCIAAHTLSRRAPSAARSPLHIVRHFVFHACKSGLPTLSDTRHRRYLSGNRLHRAKRSSTKIACTTADVNKGEDFSGVLPYHATRFLPSPPCLQVADWRRKPPNRLRANYHTSLSFLYFEYHSERIVISLIRVR
jgi:hypothetical protein